MRVACTWILLVTLAVSGCSSDGDFVVRSEPYGSDGEPITSGGQNEENPSDEENDDENESFDRARKDCASQLDVDAENIVVAGNKDEVNFNRGQAVIVRVKGNKARVRLRVEGPESSWIQGVCVYVKGNKAVVDIEVAASLRRLVYFAKGNKSRGTIDVREDASVERLTADLMGNKAALRISGEGDYSCDDVTVHGNKASLSCE